VAVAAWPLQARIRIHAPAAEVARGVAPTMAIIDPAAKGETTVVRIGGDAPWIADFVAGLPWRCEVLEPDEVRAELRARGERMARDHA
jgi:predicted DNA-binding transcriptional regulator YafY